MTNNAPWLENAVNRVATAQLGPVIEDFGRVETIGDGIAMISGLPSVRLDEVLRFQRGQLGFAQTLDTDLIGCVLLDDAEAVEAGDAVHGTGAVIRTPVGTGLLGRVIDPPHPRALKAFDEFFFSRARDVYPRYDFARMNDDEYGATLGLD